MSSQLCRGHAERSVRPAQHGAYAGCHHARSAAAACCSLTPFSGPLSSPCPRALPEISPHTLCMSTGLFRPQFCQLSARKGRKRTPQECCSRVPRGRCEQSRAGVKTAAASPVLPLSAVQPLPGVLGLGLRRTPAVGVNGPAPAPGSSWSRREEGMRVNRYQDSVGTQ